MGYAVNSAETSSHDPDQLSKAGELVDGHYSERALRNPPSLQALKLQDVLMKNAGGKIADDRWHELPLATFKQVKGFRNLTHEDVVRLFEELRSVTMRHVNNAEGHTAIYGLIAVGRVDMDEGNGRLRYKFDDEFRKIVDQSNLYAILDYRAGLAMSSRYAHRLHEMISFRAGRDRQIERFTVEELRARLGVQTGKLSTWGNFRKFALDTAIDEVNQSSRFRVSFRITKRERRKTAEVELAWEVKEVLEDAKKEQEAHSIARKGRRAETKVRLTFPESGSVKYTDPWERLARENCNWDHNKIADAFRSFCAQKGIKLDAKNIETMFVNFCKSQNRI
ncbi:replication initiation protein [uncultured Sulfitobacter sp.]|uniref:replication initiation protein n=1 Tax=uncultured Sulfitobacter sp. TaxID=191468 RepID=UPI0025938374|nr:replication initiation protein [uncultured Sulfitobacter sp.]